MTRHGEGKHAACCPREARKVEKLPEWFPYRLQARGLRARPYKHLEHAKRRARALVERGECPEGIVVVFSMDGTVIPEWEWSTLLGERDLRLEGAVHSVPIQA